MIPATPHAALVRSGTCIGLLPAARKRALDVTHCQLFSFLIFCQLISDILLYSAILFAFCLPYQHYSRDTKTRDFDTCTLIQEIARISSSCFSLSSTLRNSKPRSLVVFQLAYVYDLDTLLLPQSLPVSSHIIAVVFSRSLVSSVHRILCADISAQIQYDIFNFTECTINYSCHSS